MTGGDRRRGVEVGRGVEREEHERRDREPEDLVDVGAVEQLDEECGALAERVAAFVVAVRGGDIAAM